MTAAATSSSTTTIILRAVAFLTLVPLLTTVVGSIAIWPINEQRNETLKIAIQLLTPGLLAGLGAFLMALLDGFRLHRLRLWSVALSGFLVSAVGIHFLWAGGEFNPLGIVATAIYAASASLAVLIVGACLRRVSA